ncbi:hypothetical protein SAMN05216312_103121 [Cohnella sp. OV330]|uniref:hypothetical protein n=1 Tax=Cohnella sp. OV330 TaxID=1855288 RepID=UPI0008EED013|nr:hypothetical protein [Cohnella sp. OV330]SFB03786.1 hypothetical protein SAMN05216312_103121 [Cohnella sp. OV330]
MKPEHRPEEPVKNKLFSKDSRPLRTLSTSLGIALLANAAIGPVAYSAAASPSASAGEQPQLVTWSSEAVKSYFDPAVDWNIPLVPGEDDCVQDNADNKSAQDPAVPCEAAPTTGTGTAVQSGSSTVVVNNHYGSGLGWDDLILYHLLFNNGASYSTTSWYNSHTTYYAGTSKPYKAKKYTADSFQSKPVVGSSVRPKSVDKSGTVTRRSSSSQPGGIGSKSSGFSGSSSGSSKKSVFGSSKSSSSSSSKSSRSSSGGFGG